MERPLNRRERKKQATREKIIEATLRLLRKQGLAATSMEQIAEEADVAKGTLYNHFPSMEAIIQGYMRDVVEKHEPELQRLLAGHADTRSRLLALLQRLSRWNEENRDILLVYTSIRLRDLMATPGGRREPGNFENVIASIFQMGQDAGELRRDMPVQLLARYFKLMYTVPFIDWLEGGDVMQQRDSLEQTVDLFLAGASVNIKKAGR